MDQSWAKFGPNLAKIAFRCALAMIDVGSCGRDHRRGGCSNLYGPIFFYSIFLQENYRVILSLVLGFTPVWASCSMSYQTIVVSYSC